jgi:hypothetical protein
MQRDEARKEKHGAETEEDDEIGHGRLLRGWISG